MAGSVKMICSRPYEWFEIHPDGSVFLCCPAWLKRPVGNLLSQSVAEIWNGPVAIELRKTVLNRSFHSCSRKRCPHLSGRGGLVRPLAEFAGGPVREAMLAGHSRLAYLPRRLNLCFDQTCNLACRSCRKGPWQPTAIERQRSARLAATVRKVLLPQAVAVTLSGYGDPFVAPTYRNLLAWISPRTCPHLESLYLNSNGMLFTPETWMALPNLHPLLAGVEISLDAATAKTYAENRPGGDFERLLRNLDFIATLGVPLKLSMVVQENNFAEMPALVELAVALGASCYFSGLVNWGTFSRQEYRQRAVHLPEHPRHAELCRVLADLQGRAGVDLGNLGVLARGGQSSGSKTSLPR